MYTQIYPNTHKNAYFQKNGLSINDDTTEKMPISKKMAYPLTVRYNRKNAYFQKWLIH